MLLQVTCYYKLHVITSYMLLQVTCYYKLHVITSYMLLQVTCYYKLHVITSYMLLQVTCYYKLHVITSYMLLQVTCYYKLHVITSYMLLQVTTDTLTNEMEVMKQSTQVHQSHIKKEMHFLLFCMIARSWCIVTKCTRCIDHPFFLLVFIIKSFTLPPCSTS